MKIDYYNNAHSSKRADELNLEGLLRATENPEVARLIHLIRTGEPDVKKRLPAVTYMGKTSSGRRLMADMVPTGLVMLDIDHADDRLPALIDRCLEADFIKDVHPALIHITPSGMGLRIVFPMTDEWTTIVEAQRSVVERYRLNEYGIFDQACKDLSRLSFLPQSCDIKYIDGDALFLASPPALPQGEGARSPLNDETNGEASTSLQSNGEASTSETNNTASTSETNNTASDSETINTASDSLQSLRSSLPLGEGGGRGCSGTAPFCYNDIPVAHIAEEYVKWKGEPQEGETHNFYNAMVTDFRHICNNSPAILVDVLPLFGQTRENRKSQCDAICRRNTSVKIPAPFWMWLKEKGFWVASESDNEEEETPEDVYEAEHALLKRMPTLPPVFREYVGAAPEEFKIPTLFALLAVMGTLATYLQAQFYDGEIHTPSFFTIIYAPAGQGKSFINRLFGLDVKRSKPQNLMYDLLRRDHITEARTNLWLRFSNTKKDNEKGKNRPKTTTRILPAIFSQADFLPVMKDNQGMHMFCFAPEIDTLIKGMHAGGGGDKNDIFRVAWDNGTYGQSYRGINSFRGKVALYLNVLSTGTPAQCAKLFTDVENGLVTRCSFTDLGNQEFAAYQPWKKLSSKDLKVIEAFRDRCDANTYACALDFDLDNLDEYENDEERFDAEVPWQYMFRGRQTVNLDFINKELLNWVEKQRVIAQKNSDLAHDAFRKRAAVRAFRVALLAHACWNKVTERERKIIKEFVIWFADLDLMKSLKRWGKEYNEKQIAAKQHVGKVLFNTLFDSIPEEFTVADIKILAAQHEVLTPPRVIVSRWKKQGLINKLTAKQYTKAKL